MFYWGKFKTRVVLASGFALTIFVIMVVQVKDLVPIQSTSRLLFPEASQNKSSPTTPGLAATKPTAKEAVDTSITLFLRMSGKLPDHRHRYYCDFFRATELYWPPSFGKTVLVLDEESVEDHEFGYKVLNHTRKYFPDRNFEVLYEALPKEKSTLDFPGAPRHPGYNRQLWSSFFIDLFSNDSIIAWMDNDAAFITPVTKSMIFNGTKLRNLGSNCGLQRPWIMAWSRTSKLALGLPYVANFMTYFPVYIYRDTFTHCREYILRHLNTRNFEVAFRKFYNEHLSPVSIVLSYAWYFERDRYDWNFEICNELSDYNKQFPNGHTIGPEHVENILSEPQATFHVPYAKFLSSNILVSYCLSHKAAGNNLDICSNSSTSLSDNLVLFNHDLQFVKTVHETPCTGSKTNTCLKVLERHYNQVGLEIKHGRKIDWRDVETVEKLAGELDIQCPSLK